MYFLVLSKLQAFLPQMAAANDELEAAMRERPAEAFDVENVSDDDERHIEMDVGLGVVDIKTKDALERAEQLAGDAVVGGGGGDDLDDEFDDDDKAGDRRKKTPTGRKNTKKVKRTEREGGSSPGRIINIGGIDADGDDEITVGVVGKRRAGIIEELT